MKTCSCCDEVFVGWVEYKGREVPFCAEHETLVCYYVSPAFLTDEQLKERIDTGKWADEVRFNIEDIGLFKEFLEC